MPKYFKAIRIYLDDFCMPMVECKTTDGVVENYRWDNPKHRKEIFECINGYTLIYDERDKKSWKDI